jgi:hypothetical protein
MYAIAGFNARADLDLRRTISETPNQADPEQGNQGKGQDETAAHTCEPVAAIHRNHTFFLSEEDRLFL